MIKLKQSKDGQWYFTVQAANGRILTTSETYKSRRNALKGVAALKTAMRGRIDYKNITL